MANEGQRTRFHRSTLIKVVAELALAEEGNVRQSLGERLGQWLDFKDAIALYSVLNGAGTEAANRKAMAERSSTVLHEQYERVRASLVDAIHAETPRELAIRLGPAGLSSANTAEDFLPSHRYYLGHQRNMQSAIGKLRVQLRTAISEHAPAFERLASLDAVLEQALIARERSLLGALPQLLARRFELLREQERVSGNAGTFSPHELPAAPPEWMERFCRNMQTLLLAEVDLRLQPVLGLVEACGTDPGKSQ